MLRRWVKSVATFLGLGEQIPRVFAGVEGEQPWLLITNGKDWHLQNNVFNIQPLHHCYYDVGSEISGLTGRRYIGFSFGEWVLLTGSSCDKLPGVLVNLLSNETIELPLMDFRYDFCVLASPPSDPACHIVCFNQEEKHLMICQIGDKEVTLKKWDYELLPFQRHAVVAGKLFLTTPDADGPFLLVMVDFKVSTYKCDLLEMSLLGISSVCGPSYLFEYSGELFIVFKIMRGVILSSNVAGFMIFKADLLNKKWISIKNLGRVAIFIGNDTTHAQCAAVESGMAAKSIYFFERGDLDSYYIYNLEEGTIRMKPTFCSMETTEDVELDWIIMPSDTSFPKLIKVGLKLSNMVSEFSCVSEQVPRGVEELDFALQRPWLLITDGKDWHLQSNVFNIQPLRHCYYDVGSEISGLTGRNIGCSCGEWVLFTGSCDNLPDVLVNLLSKETIELPLMDSEYNFTYNFCILTAPPSDPACHIFYFNEEENDLIICQPGDKEYTIKKWDYEFFPMKIRTVVSGKLFLNSPENLTSREDPNRLVMVEFKECTYQFVVVQMKIEYLSSQDALFSFEVKYLSPGVYFFEYSGELFLVFKIMYGVNASGFKIFRADLLKKKWIRIRNLGRLALFIGYDTAHA